MDITMKDVLSKLVAFIEQHPRKTLGTPQAGVLMPIFDKNNTPHLLLTHRSEDLAKHSNQISFPGGKVDNTDSDIIMTALRETQEEIGLPPASIHILGLLHDFRTPYYNCVTPVIGHLQSTNYYINSEAEIADILEVPINDLLDPSIHRTEEWEYRNDSYTVHFFDWTDADSNHHNIWGATAGVIHEFLDILRL